MPAPFQLGVGNGKGTAMPGFAFSQPGLHSAFLSISHTPSAAKCSRRRTALCMKTSLQAAREQVMKVLAIDLARQYQAPREMDFSIYDDKVTFDDPTTKLQGKLMYKVSLSSAKRAHVVYQKQGPGEANKSNMLTSASLSLYYRVCCCQLAWSSSLFSSRTILFSS